MACTSRTARSFSASSCRSRGGAGVLGRGGGARARSCSFSSARPRARSSCDVFEAARGDAVLQLARAPAAAAQTRRRVQPRRTGDIQLGRAAIVNRCARPSYRPTSAESPRRARRRDAPPRRRRPRRAPSSRRRHAARASSAAARGARRRPGPRCSTPRERGVDARRSRPTARFLEIDARRRDAPGSRSARRGGAKSAAPLPRRRAPTRRRRRRARRGHCSPPSGADPTRRRLLEAVERFTSRAARPELRRVVSARARAGQSRPRARARAPRYQIETTR